ncbi:MAG: PAS domain S-box protein [SAR324 cluster bacterium]|nr:PAS domain S-box protein [SAR324 cluster bacterium]
MLLLFILCLFSSQILFAADPVILNNNFISHSLGFKAEYLEDRAGLLILEEVRSSELSQKFVPSQQETLNFGFTDSAYWIRVKIKNPHIKKNDWILEIGYPLLDDIEVYLPQGGDNYSVKRVGDLIPFRNRPIPHRHFSFTIELQAEESQVLYFRVRTEGSLQFPLVLWNSNAFMEKTRSNQILFGIYYGILIIMVFYNILLFFVIRDRVYIPYIASLICLILVQLHLNGFASEYLWISAAYFSNTGLLLSTFASIFFISLFSKEFLNTNSIVPGSSPVLITLMLVSGFGVILSFTLNYSLAVQLATGLAGLSAILFVFIGIQCWRKGSQPAKIYVIAWGSIGLGAPIYILTSFGILPNNIVTNHSLQLGVLLEVVLFSLALAYRIDLFRKEKEQAQLDALNLQHETAVKLERQNVLLQEEICRHEITEKELGDSESRLRQVIDLVPHFLFAKDKQGHFIFANQALAEAYGMTVEELTGSKESDLNHDPEELNRYLSEDQKVIERGQPIFIPEELFTDIEGNVRRLQSTKIPFKHSAWSDTAVLGVSVDITTLKQVEETLKRTNEANYRFTPHKFLKLLGKESFNEVELGDQREMNMSVLFTDIRGFTTLSEQMNQEEIFKFLNSYLSWMVPVIQENQGVVDKYIGDAIMALFDTADNAIAAAIDMMRSLEIYNLGRKRGDYDSVEIGIGINTGMLILGTVGQQDRIQTTVIGDTVNLAARTENLTKMYHAPIIITQHTLQHLENPSRYSMRFMDRVQVKGKNEKVMVYEVLDALAPETRAKKLEISADFEKAFQLFHSESYQEAKILFEQCLEKYPEDHASQIYLERCQKRETGKKQN